MSTGRGESGDVSSRHGHLGLLLISCYGNLGRAESLTLPSGLVRRIVRWETAPVKRMNTARVARTVTSLLALLFLVLYLFTGVDGYLLCLCVVIGAGLMLDTTFACIHRARSGEYHERRPPVGRRVRVLGVVGEVWGLGVLILLFVFLSALAACVRALVWGGSVWPVTALGILFAGASGEVATWLVSEPRRGKRAGTTES